jgi:hypothetical protein
MNKISVQRMRVTQRAQRIARDFKDVDWFSGPNMMGQLPNVYTRSYHASLKQAIYKVQVIIDALLQMIQ